MKALVQGRREGEKQLICGKVKGEGFFQKLVSKYKGKKTKGKMWQTQST